jgi:hypothetical protein
VAGRRDRPPGRRRRRDGDVLLLEPNPNLVGFDDVPSFESDPAAEAIQAEARAKFNARTSYSYTEQLNSGDGGVEVIGLRYADNAAGSGLPAVEITHTS